MREKIGLNAICQITFEKGAKHILAIDLMWKLEEISTFFSNIETLPKFGILFLTCFEQFAIWKRLLPHKDAFCNEILNAVWRKIGMLSKELKAKVPRPMQMMVANKRLAQSGWAKYRKLTEKILIFVNFGVYNLITCSCKINIKTGIICMPRLRIITKTKKQQSS